MTGTFQVSAGETVGIAAVEGNGERELLRAIAGLVSPTSGELIVQQPVSLVPEDRSTEGLIGDFTLTENLTLAWDRRAPWISRGMIDHAKAGLETAKLIHDYGVAAAGPSVRAGTLSGGNQQKLILARALEMAPRVVVAENPGRGLDVRATRNAFERLRMAARHGAGVVIHSTDLDELFEWCDRLLVVAKGRVHVAPPGADRETIGRIMLGVGP
jgi:simple sugar transport system ATP-binding protein